MAKNSLDFFNQPLNEKEIFRVFDLFPWEIFYRDFSLLEYNSFPTISFVKASLLPFFLNISSERALARELEENEYLQILCGFNPKVGIPTRSTIAHFREKFSKELKPIIIKLLVSMVYQNSLLSEKVILPCADFIDQSEIPDFSSRTEEFDLGTNKFTVIFSENEIDEGKVFDAQQKIRLKQAKNWNDWRAISKSTQSREWLKEWLNLPIFVRVKNNEINQEMIEVKENCDLGLSMINYYITVPRWIGKPSTSDPIYSLNTQKKQSYIACNVIVTKNENGIKKILLSQRKGNFGKNEYALPLGKMKPSDKTIEECAKRELNEETALVLGNSRVVSINVTFYSDKPWVLTIGVLAEDYSGEVKWKEKMQHRQWEWFPIDRLPEPLFLPSKLAINGYINNCYGEIHWNDFEIHFSEETNEIVDKQFSLDLGFSNVSNIANN
jgi:8-oxo-dGTP diphosphatase